MSVNIGIYIRVVIMNREPAKPKCVKDVYDTRVQKTVQMARRYGFRVTQAIKKQDSEVYR